MKNVYVDRIESLRALMRQRGWNAVLVGGQDPHASEYPARRWKQVEWLTGFTGEAGDVVITPDHAGLWTDTRYFIQANRQLAGTGVELHKTRVPEQVLIPDWLAAQFSSHTPTLAIDGLCQSIDAVDEIRAAFRGNVRIVSEADLLSALWTDRPAVPAEPVLALDEATVGETRAQKLAWMRVWMEENSCDAFLLTALDEIAWMLNVRGSDVEYNPVVISYLMVTAEVCRWYVMKDGSQEGEAFAAVRADGVEICRYDALSDDLAQLGRCCIGMDPATLNYQTVCAVDPLADKIYLTSPVVLRKAVKNPVEVEGMRKAHLEDGLAVEQFLYWLENHVGETDEWEAACKLQAFRAAIPGYRGDSFETISAWGPGAALPHYITPHENAPRIEGHGLYLVDSGGQYLCGTTDITRTVPCGPCTELEREDYTLVLKGHIALAKAVFPAGTCGCQLDVLARNPLWLRRRNFGHGTGHGVGFFLNVHEGPQDIRQNFNAQPLLPGMITSVEPGIYREGLYGVRHENLVLTTALENSEFGRWNGFETLTLCHYDTSILVKELLAPDEIQWLNEYNERVYQTLSPRLPAEVAKWLRLKTQPI